MRLLHARTRELKDFCAEDTPDYAILSHTWGDNEVTASDISDGLYSGKEVYWRKINCACKQALEDHLEWLWVDTCCLRRDDAIELDTAIHSMFEWYRDASVCYVYLPDVPSRPEESDVGYGEDTEDPEAPDSSFRRSRWFSRGWTLLELLAPRELRYYSSSWGFLGSSKTLSTLTRQVAAMAQTPETLELLLESSSVSQVMSWASGRQTSTPEDLPYCLSGIFGARIPISYGEGADQAFLKLQRWLIENRNDQSVLAWGYNGSERSDDKDMAALSSVLARTPADFSGCGSISPCKAWKEKEPPFVGFTSEGMRMRLPLVTLTTDVSTAPQSTVYAILNCCIDQDPSRLLAIPLRIDTYCGSDCIYERSGAPIVVSNTALSYAMFRVIHLRINDLSGPPPTEPQAHATFTFRMSSNLPLTIVGLRPTWETRIYRPIYYQELKLHPTRTRYIDKSGPRWVRSVIRLSRGHVDFDRQRRVIPSPYSLILVLDYAAPIKWKIPSRYGPHGPGPEDILLGPAARCYVAEDTPGLWDQLWGDPSAASSFEGAPCLRTGGRVVKVDITQPDESDHENFIIDVSSRAIRDTAKIESCPDTRHQHSQLAFILLHTLWPVVVLAVYLKLVENWETILEGEFISAENDPVQVEGIVFLAIILLGIVGISYDIRQRSRDPYEPARRYIETIAREWHFPSGGEEFRSLN